MLTSSSRVVQYALTYPFDPTYVINYKFWTEAQIHAVLSFDNGTADLSLVISTDYTLSAPGDSGLLTKVSDWNHAAVRLTIYRELDLEQETDYRNGEAVDLDLLEKDFDYAVARDQQIAETIQRSLTVPITDPVAINELPAAGERANTFLAFDSAGAPIPAVGMASVPVSPFMETLLDDADVEEARATLGISHLGYIVAAYDAPTAWADTADYQMPSAVANLSAVIAAAVAAGHTTIMLSPGSFQYSTTYAPNAAGMKIRIVGDGMERTLISNGAAVAFIAIGSSFTGKIECEGFAVSYSGAGSDTYTVINGYSDTAGKFNQAWKNIKITLTAITYASPWTMSGFKNCANLTGCEAYATGNSDDDLQLLLFATCTILRGCRVSYVGNAALTTYGCSGFSSCTTLVACDVVVSGLSTTGHFKGYNNCTSLSACRFVGDDTGGGTASAGFYGCYSLSSCYADGAANGGFNGCSFLSGCYATSNGGGIISCLYVSACYSASNVGAGFSGCQHVTACYATGNSTYGFSGSKQCQQNYATGNTSGQYTTSYADQATNACANTAAGGYNR